jgi:hypothetical protein
MVAGEPAFPPVELRKVSFCGESAVGGAIVALIVKVLLPFVESFTSNRFFSEEGIPNPNFGSTAIKKPHRPG